MVSPLNTFVLPSQQLFEVVVEVSPNKVCLQCCCLFQDYFVCFHQKYEVAEDCIAKEFLWLGNKC